MRHSGAVSASGFVITFFSNPFHPIHLKSLRWIALDEVLMQSPLASERSMAKAPNACLSVLMPIYNEIDTLRPIVSAVLAQSVVGELIAVDDGSSDGSRELLVELAKEDKRVRAFFHEVNRGKGAALRTAISAIRCSYVTRIRYGAVCGD
jgi:cellulose synthase/poly-beta-1,6-N-acetylglucosamine synthase-like glycosyltransferase